MGMGIWECRAAAAPAHTAREAAVPRSILFAAVTALAVAPPAGAQTWTGVGTANWNNSINWNPAGVPASSNGTQLAFGATPNPSMNNDINPGSFFLLNRLTFNSGSPAYFLGGTALDFRTTSGSVLPSIVMDTGNAVTIGSSTVFTNNLTVSGAGNSNLTFNGALTGNGSLTYAGVGTLTLTVAN